MCLLVCCMLTKIMTVVKKETLKTAWLGKPTLSSMYCPHQFSSTLHSILLKQLQNTVHIHSSQNNDLQFLYSVLLDVLHFTVYFFLDCTARWCTHTSSWHLSLLSFQPPLQQERNSSGGYILYSIFHIIRHGKNKTTFRNVAEICIIFIIQLT